jgi:hypothetical protein
MLTGLVNIAVFAAFAFCVGYHLPSNPDFKPSCGDWQLDIWCYGRQKRQETARGMAKTARSGKVGGKNGKDLGRCRGVQARMAVGANG